MNYGSHAGRSTDTNPPEAVANGSAPCRGIMPRGRCRPSAVLIAALLLNGVFCLCLHAQKAPPEAGKAVDLLFPPSRKKEEAVEHKATQKELRELTDILKALEERLERIESRLGPTARRPTLANTIERRLEDIERRLTRIEQLLGQLQPLEQRIRRLESQR